MDGLSIILSFVFGAVVGSFLNVVSLRFKTGKGINGRSKCMNCDKVLTWVELVPILSFLMQGGSCKKCKSKISWQYPLVEFLSGVLFVLIILTFPPVTYFAALTTFLNVIIGCSLMVIVVYDMKHKIIPDSWVFTFDFLALISLFVGGSTWFHVPTIEQLISGPLLALPFALIWVISRGEWMGLGDAKLVIGIGWLLGINAGINAVILAFWIGAALSVIWLLYTYRRFKPKTEIPFGPYLVLGMYLVMLFGVQVIDIALLRQVFGI